MIKRTDMMKKPVFFFMFLWMGVMSANAQGYHYDVNYDNTVSITDATLIINKILGKANAGEVEGLQEVDLGLPSGTIWANINVGASSPTDIGTYFAWGETLGKINYALDTYQYYVNGAYQNLTDVYGDISGSQYDAATVMWGKDWCMPTREQFEELTSNCDWAYNEYNGVGGTKFTSKTNGNSIFLPVTGYKENGAVSKSSECHYWTSTPYFDGVQDFECSTGPKGKWAVGFGAGVYRYYGRTIRPVRSPKTSTPKAVDLGLPSGTKWATFNVGASKPEEYGGYYAWGETEEKWEYNKDNYQYYQNGNYLDFGNNISGTEYDVAHVKWGGNWCMPTWDDFYELIANTTSEWVSINGVTGRKFTSKINGYSIFLPAAGGSFIEQFASAFIYSIAGISHVRFAGKYWLASRYAPGLYSNYYANQDAISRDDALDMYLRKEGSIITPPGSGDAYTHDSNEMCKYDPLWFAKSVRPVYKSSANP
jgi:hypothetical protein